MIAIVQAVPLRFSVWSVMLLLMPFMAWNSYVIARPCEVICQLESKWGTPAIVTVYETRNNGGIIISGQLLVPRLAVLNSSDMTELRAPLKNISYRQLSPDAFENLGCDARFAPCDEDVYIMHDWVAGTKHTVECFSEEGGAGQALADWLLQKAGVKHEYRCS